MTVQVHAFTGPVGAEQEDNNQAHIETVLESDDLLSFMVAKRAADGTALGVKSMPGNHPLTIAVVRNGAGDYTITLTWTANPATANIAVGLTCNTSGLVGSAVVTDATHIAVLTKTDAGVATDSIFTIAIYNLG